MDAVARGAARAQPGAQDASALQGADVALHRALADAAHARHAADAGPAQAEIDRALPGVEVVDETLQHQLVDAGRQGAAPDFGGHVEVGATHAAPPFRAQESENLPVKTGMRADTPVTKAVMNGLQSSI